jgi:hypothetical protein
MLHKWKKMHYSTEYKIIHRASTPSRTVRITERVFASLIYIATCCCHLLSCQAKHFVSLTKDWLIILWKPKWITSQLKETESLCVPFARSTTVWVPPLHIRSVLFQTLFVTSWRELHYRVHNACSPTEWINILHVSIDYKCKCTVSKVIPVQAVEALTVARRWGAHIFRHSAHRWRQGY